MHVEFFSLPLERLLEMSRKIEHAQELLNQGR
jgi:hypothetical protein